MTAKHLTKTRRDHTLWDARINSQWGGQQPVLSPEESLLAAKKLYRHAMGKAWPRKWELTSGRRYTWPRSGVFYVNPDRRGFGTRGLRDIIHLISHWCHRRLHPGDKPHSIRQLRLEAKLTKFALDRRWHEGALRKEPKPEPETTKPDKVQQRYRKIVAREMRAYQRRHGARLKITA